MTENVRPPAPVTPRWNPPGQDTLIAIVPVGHLNDGGVPTALVSARLAAERMAEELRVRS